MLVVNSPFPPYSPVEVNLKEAIEVGDLSSGISGSIHNEFAWTIPDAVNLTSEYEWFHRDGDFPAFVSINKTYYFYKMGVQHRFNGCAGRAFWNEGGRLNNSSEFFLYGQEFTEFGFGEVHGLAIRYSIPLWVAVLAVIYKVDLDADGGLSASDSAMVAKLPMDWVVKFWNLNPENGAGFAGAFSSKQKRFNKLFNDMRRVVEYERQWFVEGTASGTASLTEGRV